MLFWCFFLFFGTLRFFSIDSGHISVCSLQTYVVSSSLINEAVLRSAVKFLGISGSNVGKSFYFSCLLLSNKRCTGIKTNFCLLLFLISLSGDIETNPGPRTPKYPCGMCNKAVKANQPAICCDSCDQWIHTSCSGVSNDSYELMKSSSFVWICLKCGIPQFSDSFFEDDFQTVNDFNVLLNMDSEIDLIQVKPSNCLYNKPNKISENKQTIRCLSVNLNSLRGKSIILDEIITLQDPDIIMLQETKINSEHFSSEFFTSDYDVVRKDRTDHGGGILTAVKKSLHSVYCSSLEDKEEGIWVKLIDINNKIFYIGNYYRTGHDSTFSVNLHNTLSKIKASHRKYNPTIILAGDFNYSMIDWLNPNIRPSPTEGGNFLNTIDDFSLEQLVTENTRFGKNSQNLLDLVLTNFPGQVSNLHVGYQLSDHCIITFNLDIQINQLDKQKRKIRIYSKANFDKIRTQALTFSEQFRSYCKTNTVNENWNYLKNFIQQTTEENVPTKNKSKHKISWLTNKDKALINKRNRLSKLAKSSNNPAIRENYCKFRNKVTSCLKASHKNFVHKLIETHDGNTRKFYKYIKSKKNDSSDIPPLQEGETTLFDSSSKATLFNKYFVSVFNRNKCTTPNMAASPYNPIEDIKVTEQGVLNLLSKINVSKSIGPDEIPSRVLLEARVELTSVLTFIFNQTLKEGQLPSDWLCANVTPIHKKGLKDKVENYRPISLTCTCCKLLEHIVHSHISKYLEINKILLKNQHGFRQNHSCSTQLISALHDFCYSLNNKRSVCVAVFDFSKAFDTVPHNLLLSKLHYYGICGNVHKWITAFLTSRLQRVVLNGSNSDWLSVISGVPQGSVLGPLLFLLYINDIALGVESTVRLFADDLIVYREISSENSHTLLQNDIDKLFNWSQKWSMKFNSSKCNMILLTKVKKPNKPQYKLGNDNLLYTDSFTYLGVTISSQLNWSDHINSVYVKATRALNFIKRNLSICDTKHKSLAYTTIVRPHLEYAVASWDPYQKNHIELLNKVQSRAARFCCNDYRNTSSVSSMVKNLSWPSLADRRTVVRLAELHKIVHGSSPISGEGILRKPIRSNRSNPSGMSFINLSSRLDCYKFSFFPRTVRDWNVLPPKIKNMSSLDSFKGSIINKTYQ